MAQRTFAFVAGPNVSVVVPVRDGASWLQACLDGIAAQREAPTWELIVVDNGSRDGSADVAEDHPAVTTVVRESRPGSYAARNAGAAVGLGAVLAFTDADCVPDPGWLGTAIRAMGIGADLVAGAVVPRPNPSPSLWERYDRATYLDQSQYVEWGFAATANLVVRRTVFDAVGPFDASLRSGGDIEFCRRATAGGFRLVYEGGARVVHRPRTTLAETWRLHRRLGAGWRALSKAGKWPSIREDPSMWLRLGVAAEAVAADGPRVRRRRLAAVHATVLAARWTGRLTGT
jgi:glycosyltransferase involved in cell wall biosynthesis